MVKDAATGPDLHFHYDSARRFLAASDSSGGVVEEYIYLDGLPLARIVPAGGGPVTVTDIVIDNGAAVAVGAWTASTTLAG